MLTSIDPRLDGTLMSILDAVGHAVRVARRLDGDVLPREGSLRLGAGAA